MLKKSNHLHDRLFHNSEWFWAEEFNLLTGLWQLSEPDLSFPSALLHNAPPTLQKHLVTSSFVAVPPVWLMHSGCTHLGPDLWHRVNWFVPLSHETLDLAFEEAGCPVNSERGQMISQSLVKLMPGWLFFYQPLFNTNGMCIIEHNILLLRLLTWIHRSVTYNWCYILADALALLKPDLLML